MARYYSEHDYTTHDYPFPPYEYYYWGDCYCIVGTTLAFADYDEMIDYAGEDCIEIQTPDDVEGRLVY